LKVSSIFLAYQPSIEMYLDSETLSSFAQTWDNNSVISVGMFEFSKEQGDQAFFGKEKSTLTLQSQSGNAEIIAVLCDVMPGQRNPDTSGKKKLKFGDGFFLRNQHGEYIISADESLGLNGLQYYPRLGNTGKIILEFVGGIGEIEDEMNVQIKSTEQFIGKYNVLGAWSTPSCYYYYTDRTYEQQNWKIKLDGLSGSEIRYGDKIYLTNIHYKDQKLIKNGLYLTTEEDTDEWWIVEEPT
jgi:hypothetical protein